MSSLPTYTANACPQCGASNPPGEASCSNCGASLSPSAQAAPSAPSPAPPPAQVAAPGAQATSSDYYAIWGPRGSGKTMYLYMLREHISATRSSATRFQTWQMYAANDEARKFLIHAAESLADHRYPIATKSPSPAQMEFKFTKQEPIGPPREYTMQVLDIPGEWYEHPDTGGNTLENYLGNCKGLLCLVDPDRGEDDPIMGYLRILLTNLYFQTKRKIEKRIAFCLTKMDEVQHRPHLQNPQAYIEQKLGSRLVQTIKDYCAPGRFRLDFACSAVGYYHWPDGSLAQPLRSNSGIDWRGTAIIYDIKHIEPFGLFDPLEKWLFLG